jgi:hypothetical protein
VYLCDNGKDYRAMLLAGSGPIPKESNDGFDQRQQGLLDRFGIECRHALPTQRNKSTGEQECHARSKSVIEGWFGAWLDTFDRQQPGACGQDPFDKPDKLYVELKSREDLLLDVEYERRLVAYVSDRAVNHPNRGLKGLTPAEAMQRYSREAWGLEERHLLPEQIGELALVRDTRIVKNSSIQIRIGGEDRFYEHAAFFGMSGRGVDVAYDPSEPEDVFVYFQGRALGRATEAGKVRRDFWAAPDSVVGKQVSGGMRTQRLAIRSARELNERRAAAANLPNQAEITSIREIAIARRGLTVQPVAHAAAIDRVRKPRAKGDAADHPSIGSVEFAATGGRTRMPSAAELVKMAMEEEGQ